MIFSNIVKDIGTGGTIAPRPQMMGTPLVGNGGGIQSSILQNWVQNNPQVPKPQMDPRQRLAQFMLFNRGGAGSGGDVSARGAYRNDRLPSESMLSAMENMPGWNLPGLIARGLAKMGRGAQGPAGGGFAGATDSHGQVRGGGTGHVGGGLTQGGPR